MKTQTPIFVTILFCLLPGVLWAQQHTDHFSSEVEIFGLLELPFLLIAIVFSFLTARNLKGGKFGAGMKLLAWGFLIMAVGHLHMQIDHLFEYNLFNELMGSNIGRYAWYLALILTWGLSAFGFYKIFKASKV